jgi:hypothetical protein
VTVQTTSSKAGPFVGNGATRIWTTSFRIDQARDLEIYYTDPTGIETLLDPALYTVSGLGDPNGISVTYPISALPLGSAEKLTLLRVVDYDQQTSLTNQGGFYPAVIERALDRIVYQCQQLAEKIGRAVLVNVSSAEDPSVAFNAISTNATIAQQSAATAVSSAVAAAASAAAISLPVQVSSGGTGATDAAAARNNLGLGSAATRNIGTAASNVIQLDASGKLPAVDASALTGLPATGRLLNIVTMNSSGIYNKNSASNIIIVYVIGGGGGAGSTSGGSSVYGGGQAGAGGGCAIKRILTSTLSQTEVVTIGAGGVGGSSASVSAGQPGGTSSFGAWCSATGGGGGTGVNGQSNVGTLPTGGIGVGGDINLQAEAPARMNGYATSAGHTAGGKGAGPFGGAGAPPCAFSSNTGGNTAAANTGGGGSGGLGTYNSTTPIVAGGGGGSGVIYIFEYV